LESIENLSISVPILSLEEFNYLIFTPSLKHLEIKGLMPFNLNIEYIFKWVSSETVAELNDLDVEISNLRITTIEALKDLWNLIRSYRRLSNLRISLEVLLEQKHFIKNFINLLENSWEIISIPLNVIVLKCELEWLEEIGMILEETKCLRWISITSLGTSTFLSYEQGRRCKYEGDQNFHTTVHYLSAELLDDDEF
jgi:hypothetical protein